jgi:large subunit ribosomal protein L25
MEKIELAADQRHEIGKGPARRLRATGKVPAIFYGKNREPIKIALDLREFRKFMDEAGSNPLFDLKIRGSGTTTSRTALLKERQINPADGDIIHLDFIEVVMDEAIEVTVPLEFEGKPVGLDKGGMFQATTKDLRISCLPDQIPAVVKVDVSGLDMGHSLHVGDIPVPAGVRILQDLSQSVATVLAPKRVEEVPEEGEVPAEEAGPAPTLESGGKSDKTSS